jgi:hypothetical protein
LQVLQSGSDLFETLPRSSGFSGASVDNQIIRIFRDLWIEDVVEHSICSFNLPILAMKRFAGNRRYGWFRF